MRSALVTGGAGFIGWNLVQALLADDWTVTIYDVLHPRVHGPTRAWPVEIMAKLRSMKAELEAVERPAGEPVPELKLRVYCGDIRKGQDFMDVLAESKADTIIHLAAEVGVGQSAYCPGEYVSANVTGTVALMDWLAHAKRQEEHALLLQSKDKDTLDEDEIKLIAAADRIGYRVQQVFIAGSMSSYGEGTYRVTEHAGDAVSRLYGGQTSGNDLAPEVLRRLERGLCIEPIPTRETQPLAPTSVYAASKAHTELYALMIGRQNHIPVYVGRFFNAYGPGQALGNGYTGVIATFLGSVLRDETPLVYDDGMQSRDFIHVSDVVTAIRTILDRGQKYGIYNIATGKPTTVLDVVRHIGAAVGIEDLEPEFTDTVRVGDIRHCIGDASKLHELGWRPQVEVETGIAELCTWLREHPEQQSVVIVSQADAVHQLQQHGMTVPVERTPL